MYKIAICDDEISQTNQIEELLLKLFSFLDKTVEIDIFYTPESLIKAILPDVLVKGSDYKVEDIAGADAVINNGGRVELIDFVDGYSTSKAIEKIIASKAE